MYVMLASHFFIPSIIQLYMIKFTNKNKIVLKKNAIHIGRYNTNTFKNPGYNYNQGTTEQNSDANAGRYIPFAQIYKK